MNKTIIDQEVSYESGVGGSVTTTYTTVTYEWGPPLPNVTIVSKYKVTLWAQARPPIEESRSVRRGQAEPRPSLFPPTRKTELALVRYRRRRTACVHCGLERRAYTLG